MAAALRPLLNTQKAAAASQRCVARYGNITQRQFHATQNQHSAASLRSRLSELRRNGTPEIVFGGLVLTVVGIDYYLQQRTDQQKNEMIRQFEQEVKQDEAISRKEEKELIKQGGADMTTKFQCTVRRVPKQFDGHKCLTNLKVGDVVNVLQEGVGPDNKYNLCSIDRSQHSPKAAEDEKRISIGWFPCNCLEKVQ
ncbi:hypothetical protein ACHAWC_004538 [Mediolabrus comicus]